MMFRLSRLVEYANSLEGMYCSSVLLYVPASFTYKVEIHEFHETDPVFFSPPSKAGFLFGIDGPGR